MTSVWSVRLPDTCVEGANVILRKQHANPQEQNSSLSYCCQFGERADDALRPMLSLLVHIIHEPAFDQLRTQEQLGYVVSTSTRIAASAMALGIKIQSTRAPWFLEERVEAFLEQFRDTLAGMSQDDFEAKKDGLIIKLLERPKNLYEETVSFWGQIREGYYDFLRSTLLSGSGIQPRAHNHYQSKGMRLRLRPYRWTRC